MNRFFSDYAMLLVLALLCAFFSLSTIREQNPTGASAAEQLLAQLRDGETVFVVAAKRDADFFAAMTELLMRKRSRMWP